MGDSGHPAAPHPRPALPADGSARVIVKYRADSLLAKTAQSASAGGPRQAAALGQRVGLALTDGRVLGPRTQSLHAAGVSSAALAKRLAALPEVEWAVVAGRRTIAAVEPNDPYFRSGPGALTPGQWFLRAPDAQFVSATDALGAWSVTPGAASVTVAVLDTGVRFDHPDLAGKLYAGYDFISRTSNSLDGNGADTDASDPGDACNGEASSWHGTQVAGLVAAATDNGVGVAGLGRDVMILPVRVLGRCGGYDDDIIAGMRWAAGLSASPSNSHPAQVVNLSLGCSDPTQCGACPASYSDAIAELNGAGVAVVIAAGNATGRPVAIPGNCPGAITVAGVRHAGTKVGYSNVGPEVALAAPAGNCVLTTSGWPCLYPLVTTTNDGIGNPANNTYSDASNPTLGTSFAAPLVAGAAALLKAIDPNLSPSNIRTLLTSTVRAFPTIGAADSSVSACRAPGPFDQLECYCTPATCGAGLLDAAAAVAAAAGRTLSPAAVFSASDPHPAPASTVALDARPSRGSALGYQWSIVAGAARAHFVGSTTAAQASLLSTATGPVTVALTVTDGNGLSSTTNMTIGVDGPAVSIDAGTATVQAGQTLDLSGLASAAAGRSIIANHWDITSGDTLASFSGSTLASTATLSAHAAGTLTVQFSAADSAGDSTATTATVTVTPAPVVVSSSSGGGGGVFGVAAGAGLLAATLALRRRR